MDAGDQYWRQPTNSLTNSAGLNPLAPTCQGPAGPHRSTWIAALARQVLGSYRRDDFADPESFLLQLGMVLERYDDVVIREATSPITGIQRTCKFPPSIAEVVEFCDELRRRKNFKGDWNSRSRNQLDERESMELDGKSESLDHRKAVCDRMRDGLAKSGIFILGATQIKTLPEKPTTFRRLSDEAMRKLYPGQNGD